MADFYADWIALLRSELVAAGYDVSPADDPQRVSIKYFNVRRRQIDPRPRRIFLAREFTCPPNHTAGLESLKARAESGDDLTPHQSKSLLDAAFNDYLLNDWDIHHFHLGMNPDLKSPEFGERTGPLLFARVTGDAVYFVDVTSHGVWTQQRLVEILHNNWPENIARYRLHVEALEWVPTDEEIGKLRRAREQGGHVQSFVRMSDGTVFAPMGGGYTTSGVGLAVMDACDRYAGIVRRLESHVRANAGLMLEKIGGMGLMPSAPPRFRFLVSKEGAYAFEEGSRVAFFMGAI